MTNVPNALQFAIDPDPLLETYHSSVSRSEAETSKESSGDLEGEDKDAGSDQDDMEVDEEAASGDEAMEEVEEEVEVEKKPALRGDPGAMLFIRNLSFDSTEDELRDL